MFVFRLTIFSICLLVFICFNTSAANYVNLTQFNTESGLTQNSITGVMQDSDGYLWIATSEGLNRYDGYRITTPNSPNNILSSNFTELVWQDSKGLIWLSFSPDQNYILDKQSEQLTPIKLPSPNDYQLEYPNFTAIVETSRQDLWMATFREIYYFDRREQKYTFILSLPELFDDPDKEHIIRDILLVEQYLLIGTSKGLYALDRKTNQIKRINHTPSKDINADQNNVKKLLLDNHNRLLIGTVEGLFELDAKLISKSFKNAIATVVSDKLNIWQIVEEDGFFWLATDKGLFRLTEKDELEFIFKFSETAFNISDDDIVSMIKDREGNLWFGSRSDGVFKWHPNSAIEKHLWKRGGKNFRLNDDMVYDVLQTNENTVWIATSNGLTKLDMNQWSTDNYLINPDEKQTVSSSTIYSVSQNLGMLWLNTFDGIQVYDEQSMKKQQIVFPKTKNNIFSLPAIQLFFIDKDSLAIVTHEGIYQYQLSTNAISLMESTEIQKDESKKLFGFYNTPTGDGNSYFMAGVDRLTKFSVDSQKLSTFHHLPAGKIHNTVSGGLYREGDFLWVTYPGFGLYKLDAKTGKELHFVSEQSIGANALMDIFPDKKGNLWLTSNDGLVRINRLNYQVTKFGTKDGFTTSEFNGDSLEILPSGKVILGSIKGAFVFDPNKLGDNENYSITPDITGVSLLSSVIPRKYSTYNDDVISLAHDDFGLKIEFSALLLDKPKQVKYYYWIDGDSKIDKTLINESELFFPSFEPGTNFIHVSAVDYRNGVKSEPVSITINTRPALWLTSYAITAYVLSFILILLLYLRGYKKRELVKSLNHKRIKQSEERLKLALKGGNSGLWDWHASDNSVYEPRLAKENDGKIESTVSFKERLAAVHYKDQNSVTHQWRDFLKGKSKVFDVVYRMKESSEQWQWFRDIAMVSEFDDAKKPIRVTGTYTNITEKQEANQQRRLYSKAFENTLEIIIILDQEKNIIAANNAFHTISGHITDDAIGKPLNSYIASDRRVNITDNIFKSIEKERHWNGEVSLLKKNSNRVSVLVNAAAFFSNDSNQYYVFSMSDISKQKKAEQKLKKLVNYDPLTGLPNRTLLLDRITHAIPYCKRYNKQLAVFFVDLDRFKQINDTLGHDVGDLLLAKSANILLDSCRADDTVARIGGDEFVVMLEDIDSMVAIDRIVQNILTRMSKPIYLNDNQVTISASIGISIYPQDAIDAPALLKHADIAMYHAKNNGRNNFRYFEDHMNRTAKKRLILENNIRTAVEDEEFYLAYQPQFDISTGRLSGVEALARWKTKNGEIIPPSTFIPVAEELGLIIPMTEKLLEEALEQIALWNNNETNIQLAFNLSACHIYDQSFMPFIDGLANKYPAAIKLLEFELTESILMKDIEKAQRVFQRLNDQGIDMALDDFGTGYSSLKYLSRLPINKLKIDMSFVKKIGTSFENDAVINTIISLAKSLNLKTVAEGIEAQTHFSFLKERKVDFAQGYLFSKPIEPVEIKKIIGKNIYDLPKDN